MNSYRVKAERRKLECLEERARASDPESRWHGPSFAIGSSCRMSSGTKVYSHSSLLGASPCAPACVYLLRFPQLRDRRADRAPSVRGTSRHIWRKLARGTAIWAGVLQNCVGRRIIPLPVQPIKVISLIATRGKRCFFRFFSLLDGERWALLSENVGRRAGGTRERERDAAAYELWIF